MLILLYYIISYYIVSILILKLVLALTLILKMILISLLKWSLRFTWYLTVHEKWRKFIYLYFYLRLMTNIINSNSFNFYLFIYLLFYFFLFTVLLFSIFHREYSWRMGSSEGRAFFEIQWRRLPGHGCHD